MSYNLQLEHSDVVDFLSLIILMQNHSDEISKSEYTDEVSINDLESNSFNLDLKQDIVNNLSEKSPNGSIIDYIFDRKNKLKIAFSISHLSTRVSVIFYSSEDEFEWYSNTPVTLTQLHDDVYVNTHFHEQLSNDTLYLIQKKLLEIYSNYSNYDIYFTGYSLGGAIATLASYIIARELKSIDITTVSFGSPRIGNDKWAQSFDKTQKLKKYRITTNKDVLTALPIIGYNHVGTNIILENDTFSVFDVNNVYPWYQYTLLNCWNFDKRDLKSYMNNLTKNKWY